MKQEDNCAICYRIRCKECGWIATDEDVVQIQKGEMKSCPVCGWQPHTN